jgi:hypothetical protein
MGCKYEGKALHFAELEKIETSNVHVACPNCWTPMASDGRPGWFVHRLDVVSRLPHQFPDRECQTVPPEILRFFERIGMPLEHFPETEDCREVWQFDGGEDSFLVLINPGHNARGEPSLFGEIIYPGDRGLIISAPLLDWAEGTPQKWIEEYVAVRMVT